MLWSCKRYVYCMGSRPYPCSWKAGCTRWSLAYVGRILNPQTLWMPWQKNMKFINSSKFLVLHFPWQEKVRQMSEYDWHNQDQSCLWSWYISQCISCWVKEGKYRFFSKCRSTAQGSGRGLCLTSADSDLLQNVAHLRFSRVCWILEQQPQGKQLTYSDCWHSKHGF